MLDETEFLELAMGFARSRATTWSIPISFTFGDSEYRVDYEPAESSTGLFGGNSNWRGPIWMPVNILLIRGAVTLLRSTMATRFTIECPTGSGRR